MDWKKVLEELKKHPVRWFIIICLVTGFLFPASKQPAPSPEELQRKQAQQMQKQKEQQEKSRNLEVAVCAQSYIKQVLAPKPTSFPWGMPNDSVTFVPDGNKYMVRSYVDTENDFGGKIRRNFMCFVELPGGDICPTECKWL